MENVVEKEQCQFTNCNVTPVFNKIGKTKGIFCKTRKKDELRTEYVAYHVADTFNGVYFYISILIAKKKHHFL
jgi:hypothetical protein